VPAYIILSVDNQLLIILDCSACTFTHVSFNSVTHVFSLMDLATLCHINTS